MKPIQKSSSLKSLKIKNTKIAVVLSRFNEEIGRSLLLGTQQGLRESGIAESDIHVFEVPGAFEIPLAALTAARSRRYGDCLLGRRDTGRHTPF
jgi:6,7-dimethyl-8-ribityllumazine synthase